MPATHHEYCRALDQSDAKSFSSTTIYGKACEFDAVADLEELQIRSRLQINSVLKPPDSIWSSARPTTPTDDIAAAAAGPMRRLAEW